MIRSIDGAVCERPFLLVSWIDVRANSNRRRKLSVGAKLLFASGALQEATVTAGGIVTIIFTTRS